MAPPVRGPRLVAALLVFLVLWLDGSFYPLILLPLLFAKFFLKDDLSRIGLGSGGFARGIVMGVSAGLVTVAASYPILLHYRGVRPEPSSLAAALLTDLIWYPVYEEISYRGFFMGVFARREALFSGRNLLLNLLQALLFLSVHHHHVSDGVPLLLLPVFLLGFLNGLVFIRSGNISGCVLGHALVNMIGMITVIR